MTLRHVHTAAGVEEALPQFVCSDQRWETRVRETKELLGKVRCIQGVSLRADCRVHRHPAGPYKCHIDIKGDFVRADAEITKCLVAGHEMTTEEHKTLA